MKTQTCETVRRTLTLTILQTDIVDPPEQTKILLRSPQVLSSLLNICLSRNWLTPSMAAVQLTAHLTQAVPPPPRSVKESDKDLLKFSQLPDISLDEVEKFKDIHGFDRLIQDLESSNDPRTGDVKKAVQNWSSVQIIGSAFKGQLLSSESHLLS